MFWCAKSGQHQTGKEAINIKSFQVAMRKRFDVYDLIKLKLSLFNLSNLPFDLLNNLSATNLHQSYNLDVWKLCLVKSKPN